MSKDEAGQPLNPFLNQTRRIERDISEFLGIAKGVIADGAVNESEAVLVRNWIHAHTDAAQAWPLSAIVNRIEKIFHDTIVDEDEKLELRELLKNLVGGNAGVIAGDDASTALPLCVPPPEIAWQSNAFVLTGTFAFGTRSACENAVISLGGTISSSITKRTRYLVIGTFGSRDWVHTSFGRKIEKAVEYRSEGAPISIVSEDHWANSLP